MDSPQLFISFGAVMLVVALLGVAIDWFGKPLRHRRFVPKIYRFPDERQPRRSKVRATEWSETSLVLPVVEAPAPDQLIRYPDPLADPHPDAVDHPQLGGGRLEFSPPTAPVPVVEIDAPTARSVFGPDELDLVTLEDTDPDASVVGENSEATESDEDVDAHNDHTRDPGSRENRKRGWVVGSYIFNLEEDGAEPKPATIQTRYWKNVAATSGASVFGDANVELMGTGHPPQRRNPRTGKVESMRLPNLGFDDTDGHTPVPAWPCAEIDPFR